MVGKEVVEVAAVAAQPVGREVGEVGPLELERLFATAVDAQSFVMQPAGLDGGVDAELGQRAGGTRSEAVATDLLAREVGLLEEGDVHPALSQVRSGRGAAWSRSDDHDIRFGRLPGGRLGVGHADS